MRYLDRKESSFYNPQCQGCFLRFTNDRTREAGCVGLDKVPDGKCSFHKTQAEQDLSLVYSAKRNGTKYAETGRMKSKILKDLGFFV